MDPVKVRSITDWEALLSKRQLQRFLGFANFYRRFIRDFSGIARALYDLTKKDTTWRWSPEHGKAFSELKAAFLQALALAIYDWSKEAVVEVDASNWACGGTLS
jgi:RNase H-like domain found in reverse transcriptase